MCKYMLKVGKKCRTTSIDIFLACLTLSCLMLKNGQTHFKNLAIFTLHVHTAFFQIMHESVILTLNKYFPKI